MVARLLAFCRIRWNMLETVTKWAGLVVKTFIGPQQPQHRDAARLEEEVGGNDHHEYQQEKDAHGHAGLLDGPGKVIGGAQEQQAQDGLWNHQAAILFPLALALHELDGVGKMDLGQVI